MYSVVGIKIPLAMPVSYIGVPVQISDTLLPIQPLLTHVGSSGSQSNTWACIYMEDLMELLVPGFSVAQPQLLHLFEE